MYKFVWDTSAIINLKESNDQGYSPARSFYKDFFDGWIDTPYQNIFPSLGVFEVAATVSRKQREGTNMLREFYIIDDNSIVYELNQEFISKSYSLFEKEGFCELRGADLVFACIAFVENAFLITLDKHFTKHVSEQIKIIDLNESRDKPVYRELFE